MAEALQEIESAFRKHKKEIVDKYKVREIGVFGSYVRGEQKKGSDVDIFVDFDDENYPDLLTLIEMERYIARLLKKKVDLGTKDSIRKELRNQILKEAVYL